MSLDLIPEDDVRAALHPYRVDRDTFEAAVRERLEAAQKERDEPLARLSPLLRSAATFLPLEVLAGCKGTAVAAKLAPAGGIYKLLGFLAFPAISLFVLLGAAIFSVTKIRTIQNQPGSEFSDQAAIQMATHEWWQRHLWSGIGVFVVTLVLMLLGKTWILFLFYVVSFGILVWVISSFAKLGLGNRQLIGQSCGSALMSLGQVAIMSGIGFQEIHFIDQKVIGAIFLGSVLMLLPFSFSSWQVAGKDRSEMVRRNAALAQRWGFGCMVILLLPLIAWLLHPILWPATPAAIKRYVDSLSAARDGSATWKDWEIVARWAIDSKLDPELSNPRRLLAGEIAGEQNRYILTSAMHVGLLSTDQIVQLKEYETLRRSLVAAPPRGSQPQPISPLDQYDWVIRAAMLRSDLSSEERDTLEQRLYATLDNMSKDKYVVLETALRVTQLLDVIGRPLDRDQYRGQIHDWLRKFHSKGEGWGRIAGGFKQYLNISAGDLTATAHAVELIELYGAPEDLDLNWVRSFLRPGAYLLHQKWEAAAALQRLNHLPGVQRPTWPEVLYYERTLLAAIVLVGLCLYATLISPPAKFANPTSDSAAGSLQNTANGPGNV